MKGTYLDEHAVRRIDEAGVYEVTVRSPVICETRRGICSTCYGRDLARGHRVNLGEAVGVIAAQSIGEPGTQLTMRTFHIGGAASRSSAANNIQVKNSGFIRFHNIKKVDRVDGKLVTISRSGQIAVVDEHGREREQYKLPYGSDLMVADGAAVDAGQIVAKWDPHSHPIISEVKGRIRFIDLLDGVSMSRQVDEMTGLSSIVVEDAKRSGSTGKELRPMVRLVDERGDDLCIPNTNIAASYNLPTGAVLNLENDAEIGVGDVIARIPQEGSKTRDITGVCREWLTCSRRGFLKKRLYWLKFQGLLTLVKRLKTNAVW